jgi:hypothetical protein
LGPPGLAGVGGGGGGLGFRACLLHEEASRGLQLLPPEL